MLTARQTDFWGNTFEIGLDGQTLTTFKAKQWGNGVRFTLHGLEHELRSNAWGTRYELLAGGAVLASADRVGRKDWTLVVDGHSHQFQRVSFWKRDQALVVGSEQVGTVRRTSAWKTEGVAELPTLPLPVRVFALAVVLTMWQAADRAAASS